MDDDNLIMNKGGENTMPEGNKNNNYNIKEEEQDGVTLIQKLIFQVSQLLYLQD